MSRERKRTIPKGYFHLYNEIEDIQLSYQGKKNEWQPSGVGVGLIRELGGSAEPQTPPRPNESECPFNKITQFLCIFNWVAVVKVTLFFMIYKHSPHSLYSAGYGVLPSVKLNSPVFALREKALGLTLQKHRMFVQFKELLDKGERCV